MRLDFSVSLFTATLMASACSESETVVNPLEAGTISNAKNADFAIVVHGGVNGGVAPPGTEAICQKDQIASKNKDKVLADLRTAINKGYEILAAGGSAEEAAVAAVTVLEDSPYFDAGKGSFETQEGTIELDASIMRGWTKDVGSVIGVTSLKNPIKGARAIMNTGQQVMMFGKSAEDRAKATDSNLELVDPSYFKVERDCVSTSKATMSTQSRHGTIGAVALDKDGHIVAATSTGGYIGKIAGRVGDSPIIGAGNYANKLVGISSSGIGEFFIRHSVGHTIASRMEYLNEPLDTAVVKTFDQVYENMGWKNWDLAEVAKACGADPAGVVCNEFKDFAGRIGGPGLGGVIGLDQNGNVFDYFRFAAFARGFRTPSDTDAQVKL